jgi:hypothetical protein
MSIEELKNKAEEAWVGCDGCIQDDKAMWINGYLAGALSNQIELPSDDEIKEKSNKRWWKGATPSSSFTEGAKWVINHIKQQDK